MWYVQPNAFSQVLSFRLLMDAQTCCNALRDAAWDKYYARVPGYVATGTHSNGDTFTYPREEMFPKMWESSLGPGEPISHPYVPTANEAVSIGMDNVHITYIQPA